MSEVSPIALDLELVKDAIVCSGNEAEQLRLVVKACSQAIGDGACSVWLAKENNSRIELAASYGYDFNYEDFAQQGEKLPDYPLKKRGRGKIGITGWIFRARKPFHARKRSDFKKCYHHLGRYDSIFWKRGREAQAFYGTYIPAISDIGTIGVIKVEHRKPHYLDDANRQGLIEVIAATLGGLLDTSRLDALTNALTFLTQGALAQNTYDQVVELCRETTRAEACSLFIFDKELNRLVMRGDSGHDRHFVWDRDTNDPKYSYGPPEPGKQAGLTWEVLWLDDGVMLINSHEELIKKEGWTSLFWSDQWRDKNKILHSLYMRRIGTKERPVGVLKVENKLGPNNQTLGQLFSSGDQKVLDAFSRSLEAVIILHEAAPPEVRAPKQYIDTFGDEVLDQILEQESLKNTGLVEYAERYKSFHKTVHRLAERLKTRNALAQPLETIAEVVRKELLPNIGIQSDIGGLLNNLAEAENVLLFRQQAYRDHAIHTFNVFMLGYAILLQLSTEHVETMQGKLDELFAKSRQNVDLVQAWTLASLFHDVGEPVQWVRKSVGTYLESIFNVTPEMREKQQLVQIMVKLALLDYFPYAWHLDLTTQAATACLRAKKQHAQIHDAIMSALNDNFNHGVVSAVLLSERLSSAKARVNRATQNAVMSAIILHDRAIWPRINKEWINLHEHSDFRKLSFYNQPLAFLLMYCDNAQEYGRAYVDPQNLSKTMEGIPRVMNLDVNNENRRVFCELLYDKPSDETKEQIKKAYGLLKDSWTSLDDELEWEIRSRNHISEIDRASFPRRVQKMTSIGA